MEISDYKLQAKPVSAERIRSDYAERNKIYFSIEKNSKGEEVCFYNPEFAFEKQHLVNASARKAMTYLQAAEKYPNEYAKFQESGILFIQLDNDDLNIFVRHISDK